MAHSVKKFVVLLIVFGILLVGCKKKEEPGKAKSQSATSRTITVDGSSTVFPITEAVAEEFQKVNESRVTIGVSGSGGGFKKFGRNEIIISNASRPIKQSEIELCRQNGIEFIELPVASDGIAVVVHREAHWVDSMTVEELKTLWSPVAQGKITRWSQIRTGWPDKEIHLFGPGIDSGTYDYFTQAIVGEEHSSRGDFTSSEDDNVLVRGIATDVHALGFFGLAYYVENRDMLKIVPIDDGDSSNGNGAIVPSIETVADGTYQPLSRPLFIYVNMSATDNAKVNDFINYYIDESKELILEVGYIPLPGSTLALVKKRFNERVVGSIFAGGGAMPGVILEELLK